MRFEHVDGGNVLSGWPLVQLMSSKIKLLLALVVVLIAYKFMAKE
jgi:hypothetical protein